MMIITCTVLKNSDYKPIPSYNLFTCYTDLVELEQDLISQMVGQRVIFECEPSRSGGHCSIPCQSGCDYGHKELVIREGFLLLDEKIKIIDILQREFLLICHEVVIMVGYATDMDIYYATMEK